MIIVVKDETNIAQLAACLRQGGYAIRTKPGGIYELESSDPTESQACEIGETRVIASWELSLYCECPICRNSVDLLDTSDFMDARKLSPCEHDTERSKGVEVSCPMCQEDFLVDLVF